MGTTLKRPKLQLLIIWAMGLIVAIFSIKSGWNYSWNRDWLRVIGIPLLTLSGLLIVTLQVTPDIFESALRRVKHKRSLRKSKKLEATTTRVKNKGHIGWIIVLILIGFVVGAFLISWSLG